MALVPKKTGAEDIPVEIWYYIASFLTQEQLKQMYTVNRTFFHLSMSLRYEKLEIREMDELVLEKYLFISSNNEMKRNVRSLTLDPDLFFRFPIPNQLDNIEYPTTSRFGQQSWFKSRITWKRFWRMFIPKRIRKEQPFDFIHYFHNFIGILDHVTELTIDSRPSYVLTPDPACSQAFLGPGWRAFGLTLRSLVLKDDVSLLGCMLAESLHLEGLEVLSVEVGSNKGGMDLASAFLTLNCFIRRHSGTLTGLEVVSRTTTSTWFDYNLGHIPHLQKLKIALPVGIDPPWYESKKDQFLLRHVGSITDLEWGFSDKFLFEQQQTYNTSTYVPFNLTFPKLQRFAVTSGRSTDSYIKSVGSFIGHQKKTLTKLSLSKWVLSLGRFALCVDAAASPSIIELDISVKTLTSRVFATLAIRFPSLEVLRLSYIEVGRQLITTTHFHSAMPITTSERLNGSNTKTAYGLAEFKEDMETLNIGNWPVVDLNIRKVQPEWRNNRMESVGKVIVANLPRVEFVNGMYRLQFMSVEEV